MSVQRKMVIAFLALLVMGMGWATGKPGDSVKLTGDPAQDRALRADAHPGEWLLHGRSFSDQFFSPLEQINDATVKQLGVAWTHDDDSLTGLVSQPLMVDGTVYYTGMYSTVTALDAGTGKQLWQFMPADITLSQKVGNNPVAIWNMGTNRGLAYWDGTIFQATGDCRLLALDAKTGRQLWETRVCDIAKGYAISGAPRVAAGKVFIGSSGSDNAARGYIAAFDAKSGKQIWRFWTVPAKVDGKFESDFYARIAKTWDDGKWELGGAVVWESITYDPDFNRLYVGTSCTGPLDPRLRNPSGGDQLFECAIVAVDADTGKYVWHFSTTPNYAWDYDAVMPIVTADLMIDGKPRKVLMQAPKNGFFFVIDRATGKFISAKNYARVNWATGFDTNGRPIYSDDARYWLKPGGTAEVWPGDVGAHNIQPMSFSPKTGLVYIPTCDFSTTFTISKHGSVFGGVGMKSMTMKPGDPATPKILGHLVAWDPATQTAKWSHAYPTPCNGGTMSTAGNLVFQGDNYGKFRAFDATTGGVLWSQDMQSAITSAPITYTYKGEQYVLLLSGLGGQARSIYPLLASAGPARVVALKLGAKGTVPPYIPLPLPKPSVPDSAPPAQIAQGARVYKTLWCAMCHGSELVVPANYSRYPDLRRISKETYDNWEAIVLGGKLSDAGMFSFASSLNHDDAMAVRAYVIDKAWADYHEQEKNSQVSPGK